MTRTFREVRLSVKKNECSLAVIAVIIVDVVVVANDAKDPVKYWFLTWSKPSPFHGSFPRLSPREAGIEHRSLVFVFQIILFLRQHDDSTVVKLLSNRQDEARMSVRAYRIAHKVFNFQSI